MFFKKKKVNKTFSKKKVVSNVIWLLSIVIIFFLWISVTRIIETIDFHLLDFAIWKNSFISKVTSSDVNKEKINILIVWRWWWTHDAPNLTDTIILWSINTEKNVISMLSIPRDLYVEYPDSLRKWKINWIYEMNLWVSEDKAMAALEEKITEITWEFIDYHVNIDFNWFQEIIDVLWWIEVTLKKQFIDYEYPNWSWWYTTFMLKKWTWILDWENALKYARSRHSTSDFSRSLRQQNIIKAIKQKLLELGYFKDSSKIKDLFLSLDKNIKTNIDLKDLIKIWLFFKQNNTNILSYNLNDSCYYWSTNCAKWWFLYVPLREYFGNQSVLLPYWANVNNIGNYELIHRYSDNIFNKPDIFKENYEINIFNAVKIKYLASGLADELIKYWLNIPKVNSLWNIKNKTFKESIIYYNNIDENSYTLNMLTDLLEIKTEKTEKPIYSKSLNARIEIILWDDYKQTLIKIDTKNIY